MSTARRSLAVLASVLAVVFFALPSFAAEEEAPVDTVTETTVAEEQSGVVDVAPAVTVPPAADEEVTADWTYRYLIPTLLALAIVVVIATTIQYFMRVVRSRYKVVE
jgi:hypothetical protein